MFQETVLNGIEKVGVEKPGFQPKNADGPVSPSSYLS